EGMGARIALLAGGLTAISIGAPGVGAIVTIFLSALAISAAAIVWFSLLIRKALLLVAIVFGPIALAGATWDATKGWFTKWVTFVIALILSKLVLVVIFLVAGAQVSAPIDADLASISDPIAGIVLMFIAAFAPYITYKFLSFIGFDMYHAMSSEQEAKSALNRPVPVPSAPLTERAKKVLGPSSEGESATPPQGSCAPTTARGGGPAASPGSASASTGASSTGAAGGSTASAGTAGAASAAGPTGAAVAVGAAVATKTAKTGPRVGNGVGQTAEAHTQSADDSAAPAPPNNPPRVVGPRHPRPSSPSPDAASAGRARRDV
ncbi:MAG TPA: type IV secretion system protein, partial [Microterricola sp.]